MSAPRTFISYSWDDDEHKTWVRELATLLRNDGVDVILDQWHVQPGDQLPAFMERAIRESDFVLIVCTPKYKAKSDDRSKGCGGVAYEGDVIQGEVFTRHNHRKFIPILRRGNWIDSAPSQLSGKAYIGLQDEETLQANYRLLLRTLHGTSEPIPDLGRKPEFPFPPSLSASAQDDQRTGLAAGGVVVRSGGNKPFVGQKGKWGFAFSRDFRELLEVAQTSDTSSWPKILSDKIKRIDFKPYSATELAAIKEVDSRNVINWGGWNRYRKATIKRIDNTTEDVILENTVTLYGPEGESYYLGSLTIQGLVAK